LKKNLKRLRKLQRQLSRKQKGSKQRSVARKKVAKLHAKIQDRRTDFLHKLSTRVIKENQLIALEDLNVSGIVKNRKLSRAISDLVTQRRKDSEGWGRDGAIPQSGCNCVTQCALAPWREVWDGENSELC